MQVEQCPCGCGVYGWANAFLRCKELRLEREAVVAALQAGTIAMTCRILGVVLRQWRECTEVLVAALANPGRPCKRVGRLVVSATEPPEASEAGRRLLRGMASLWDAIASEDKGAIAATQAVASAVLRLLAAARRRHEPVELAAIERLQRRKLTCALGSNGCSGARPRRALGWQPS